MVPFGVPEGNKFTQDSSIQRTLMKGLLTEAWAWLREEMQDAETRGWQHWEAIVALKLGGNHLVCPGRGVFWKVKLSLLNRDSPGTIRTRWSHYVELDRQDKWND